MSKLKHWTQRSIDDFVYKVSADFVQQIENYLSTSGENRKEFADRIKRTPGRVSQVLNSPGNMSLKKMIEYARAAGKKVAVVAYDDNDPTNAKGLINSQVFERCWELQGRPADFFAFNETDKIQWYVMREGSAPPTMTLRNPIQGTKVNGSNSPFSVSNTAITDKGVLKMPHYVEGANDG